MVCFGAKGSAGSCALTMDLDGDGRAEKITVEGGAMEGPLVAVDQIGRAHV